MLRLEYPKHGELVMTWTTETWMSAIDDDKSLAHLSIPGSHDSLATEKSLAYDLTTGFLGEVGTVIKYIDEGAKLFSLPTIKERLDSAIASQAGNAQTTTQSISNQLQDGIRFFDFRFRLADNQLWGQHGMVPMKISGKQAIKQIDDYLEEYPSETVIVNIQAENNGGQSIPVSIDGWGADYKCTAPLVDIVVAEVPNYLDPGYVKCKVAKESRDKSWGAVRTAASVVRDVGNTWNPSPTYETNVFRVADYSNTQKKIEFNINVNDWVNNNVSFASAVRNELIDSLPGKEENWFLEDRIPSLDEVRGKIVMINNFDQDDAIGIMTGGSIPREGDSGDHLWFDNQWDGITKEDKLARNIASMEAITVNEPDRLSIVFTSASSEDSNYQPTHYSDYSNPLLLQYFKGKSGPIGTIAGDFFDKDIVAGIIQTNRFTFDGKKGPDQIKADSLDDSWVMAGDYSERGLLPFHFDLDGERGDDLIYGDDGDDIIKGGNGDDKICGKKGDDTLLGGKGLDVLKGGRGQDVLWGGKDADCLGADVDCNADTLIGGSGADFFVLSNGNVDIKDFSENDILIVVSEFLGLNELKSDQKEDDVWLSSMGGFVAVIRDSSVESVLSRIQFA